MGFCSSVDTRALREEEVKPMIVWIESLRMILMIFFRLKYNRTKLYLFLFLCLVAYISLMISLTILTSRPPR